MRSRLLAFVSLFACLACRLAAVELVPGQTDGGWPALFASLRAQAPLQASFEETRYFPFKKTPAVLRGDIRFHPERGLSLHYTSPEDRLLVLDAAGGVLADAKGRRRELPSDPRAQGATNALLHVLRFDLDELSKNFVIDGTRDGPGWRLAFTPRPGPLASVLDPVIVTGLGSAVLTLELRKSDSQRIEIRIGETHARVTFTGEELARFFR